MIFFAIMLISVEHFYRVGTVCDIARGVPVLTV